MRRLLLVSARLRLLELAQERVRESLELVVRPGAGTDADAAGPLGEVQLHGRHEMVLGSRRGGCWDGSCGRDGGWWDGGRGRDGGWWDGSCQLFADC